MSLTLHLGCGRRKRAGAIGLDINPASQADVVCDLNRIPYPFPDNTFDMVVCEHVLEHLNDVVAVIEEIHRITTSGGVILVEVPHFSSVYFFQDPTHRHAFTSRSFDYFIPGRTVYEFGYSAARLELISVRFPPSAGSGFVKRRLFAIINRHLDFYEKRLAFIMPRHLLRFELRVVK